MPIHRLLNNQSCIGKHATRRNELLARAGNISPRDNPHYWCDLGMDATAILASLAESSNWTLSDSRTTREALNAPKPTRTPHYWAHDAYHADSKEWLLAKNIANQTLYIWPDVSERKESASAKKVLTLRTSRKRHRLCYCLKQQWIVPNAGLWWNALDWRKHHARAPDYTLTGNSSRFDIYLTKVEKTMDFFAIHFCI